MSARREAYLEHTSPASSRRRILEAAREVIERRGFQGFSMESVAAAAGVARRTIYNQFEDREVLHRAALLELVDAAEAMLPAMLGKELPLAAAVRTFCIQACAVLSSEPYRRLRQSIDRDGAFVAWLPQLVDRRLLSPLRQTLHTYVLRRAAQGALRLHDADELCEGIIQIVELSSKSPGMSTSGAMLSIDELVGIVLGRLAPTPRAAVGI